MSDFSSSSSSSSSSLEKEPSEGSELNAELLVSIVIPVLNESVCLAKNLPLFSRLQSPSNEIIFVDGGSTDSTVGILRSAGFRVVSSKKGRANQMNAGAEYAAANSVLFLHADVFVPENFRDVQSLISGNLWGFFKVRLYDSCLKNTPWVYRVIAAGINMRAQLFGVATGDQGIFVDKNVFKQLGGFPDIVLMEDIALSRKLKKQKNPKILDAQLNVSARRWEQQGILKTVLLMWGLQLAYVLGVSPERLASWYR